MTDKTISQEPEQAEPDTTETSEKASPPPPRFIYNCVRCGHYCKNVEGVPVTFQDLRTWQDKQMMSTIMPNLELLTDEGGNPRLILAPQGGLGEGADPFGLGDINLDEQKGSGILSKFRKKKTQADQGQADEPNVEGEGEDAGKEEEEGQAEPTEAKDKADPTQGKGCPFHDNENNLCQIYHALPSSCAAYPLGSNGDKYFIVDKACQGLGEGKMSVESLKEIRNSAKADFVFRTETGQLLTTLYGLFMGQMAAQSARMMGNLDPEKLKQLGDLLGQTPPGDSQ